MNQTLHPEAFSCILLAQIYRKKVRREEKPHLLAKITSSAKHRAPVMITQNASASQYRGIKARSCLGEVGDLQLKNAAKKRNRSVSVEGRGWRRTSRLSGCKLLLASQDYANWHTKVIHGWLGDTKWVLMSKNSVTPSLVIWTIQPKDSRPFDTLKTETFESLKKSTNSDRIKVHVLWTEGWSQSRMFMQRGQVVLRSRFDMIVGTVSPAIKRVHQRTFCFDCCHKPHSNKYIMLRVKQI